VIRSAPAPAIEILLEPERDTIRVVPVGELDLATVPLLRDELERLLVDGFKSVVIDLRRLDFMDSSGLRLLLEANGHARNDGWELALIQGPEAVRRVFEITRTVGLLPFTTAAGGRVSSR
jgi:anti-sigma B factor antagonist